MTTPLAAVLEHYQLPPDPVTGGLFEFKAKQVETINSLAPLGRAGWYCEVATGKTAMCTIAVLYKKLLKPTDGIVLMPPILIVQWDRWLRSIRRKATGLPLTTTLYRGTPVRRKELDLTKDFTLMSMGVFKNDFDYLRDEYAERDNVLLVDEATSIKNVASQNYRKVKEWVDG